MLLKSLESLVHSEVRARRYLVQQCWPLGRRFCVRCRGRKLYRLLDKRYRCGHCGYTFHDFTGRWIDALNLTAAQWLWITKLFELEFAPGRIALEIGISYPTAFKAVHVIRCALFSAFVASQSAEEQAVLATFLTTSRIAGGKSDMPLALGIFDKNRHATIRAVKNLTPQSLHTDGILVARRGAAIYSDRCAEYDAVLFSGGWRWLVSGSIATKMYSDSADGFWKFLRDFLALRHGVSRERFPLYLIECQFRYNHRDQRMFELLIHYLTQFVPNYSQVERKIRDKKNVADLRRVSQ
jgi:transposase